MDWSATHADRETIFARVTGAPFAPRPRDLNAYKTGLGLLLDWLEDQSGCTWQDRWHASRRKIR